MIHTTLADVYALSVAINRNNTRNFVFGVATGVVLCWSAKRYYKNLGSRK